jgi:cytochrome c oxidase subunit 2
MTRILLAILPALFLLYAMPALAQPEAWEISFQEAGSLSALEQHQFHNFLLCIIIGITLFVMALLLYVMVRYNKRANPVASQTSHNVLIEIIWTVVPILILVMITIPSFRILYYTDRTPNPEMTLEARGFQWYWGFNYPDNGDINFQAYMIPEKEIDKEKGQVRLLSTDNPVMLPIDTNIRILVTAEDVIHAFAVPALGVKIDAVPGHTNETWMRITKPGIYYGQCSELCGKDHAYMPIEIHAVSKDEFNGWVEKMKTGGQSSATQATPAPNAIANPKDR